MHLTVSIPKPPSLNNLFANAGKRGRVKTPAYEAWIEEAGYALNRQTAYAPPIQGPVYVHISVNKGGADLDNLPKAVLDLLVKHRLIDDDRNVVKLTLLHSPGFNDNAVVTIRKFAADEAEQGRAA